VERPFYSTFGHCRVPRGKYSLEDKLGKWVGRQREAKHKNKLSAEREAKLNSMGFIWKIRQSCLTVKEGWDTRFEQLEEYEKANGDCNVPTHYSENVKLGDWVGRQRHGKRTKQMSEEHEAKLNSIGFLWNESCWNNADWDMHFRQLLEYKHAFGDCNVPHHFSRNLPLGHWVQTQQMKDKMLTTERWTKLNSLGFDWGRPKSDAPNEELEDEYKTQHELCHSPGERYSSARQPTYPLGKTLTELRFNIQKGVLQERERVAQLNANAVLRNRQTTDKNENWDAHFRELLGYLQAHGDFNVPQCYPCNPLLARWVSEQRNDYDLKVCGEQTSLTPLREAKLDAIGFPWAVGGTEEDPAEGVYSSAVRPEETESGKKVRSKNISVARPDRGFTSG
jgi:hypothetical protein